MTDATALYIDGGWVEPEERHRLDVIDPSTEESCATISLGGQRDTDAAVAAARRAFASFSQSTKADRLDLLAAILDRYKARSQEIAEAISLEMGAPIDLSMSSQMPAGSSHLKNFIRALEGIDFEAPLNGAGKPGRVHLEPVGVCALITPWNWPMNQVTLKVGAAIAAGCTMVLKPSEIAPLSSMVFAEVMHEAGVPAGVFNLVNGDGAGVGSQLSSHPDVDMVSFTGSTRAGRAITKAGAETIKRVALELGGKGANILFDDADDTAVRRGVAHCMENTGQSCNAPTRMLVQNGRYDAVVEEAGALAAATSTGPAREAGEHIGPLVSAAQYDKVQSLIETGLREGARLVAGGPGRPEGTNRGYFVRPTVFADVTNDMTIAQKEIFGPVLSILRFETEADAIRIANDTPYGLTDYVQTQDPDRARRVARALRAGMVVINGGSRGSGAPFGGMKQSGNGREGGRYGIEEFLEVKSIGGWPG
ncbi:MAG: aldehyde dehydrogenase family protein [Rhodobacteraceae bacterium]|nr:aldehyde dehydrogenase family protein [Paracoccaceae bacterium]